MLGLAIVEFLKHLRLVFLVLERAIKSVCYKLDGYFIRRQNRLVSFANAYRVVAKNKIYNPIQSFITVCISSCKKKYPLC